MIKMRLFFTVVIVVQIVFAQNESDPNFLGSDIYANQMIIDSDYHKGALLVLDSNKDPRSLKSTFCLSCHDGSLASTGHTTTNFGNPDNVGPSSIFSFNHPVAFEFSSSFAFSRYYLNDPYTTSSGLGGTIAEDLLVDGWVECITCHNIFFDTRNQDKNKTLSVGEYFSELCMTCHNI